jgi:hypothetical protein
MASKVPVRQLFIGGKWRAPLKGKRLSVINPATGETIGGEWNAKQYSGDLEGSAAPTFDLQRQLATVALRSEGSSPVSSSFSYVSPSSAIFQTDAPDPTRSLSDGVRVMRRKQIPNREKEATVFCRAEANQRVLNPSRRRRLVLT